MNLLLASAARRAASARWLVCPLLLGAVVFVFGQSAAHAAGCRPQDEIWFIDARPAACSMSAAGAAALPQVSASRRAGSGTWQTASLEEFLADETDQTTLFWVHGNRIESGESRQRGWEFYCALARHADLRPLRFVIWSWPADQVRGPLNDVRYKAMLTEPAAYHLARVLRQMNPTQPVGLAGFSFGARVITGALHLQAGGRLGNYQLPQQAAENSGPVARTVLWASALNDDWLLPGRYHGLALNQTLQTTLLNNSCDRALKRYRFVSRCSNPEALGYWGLAVNCLGENRGKVTQMDVGCMVGRVHSDCPYIYNSGIMSRTWNGLAGEIALASKNLADVKITKSQLQLTNSLSRTLKFVY